MPKLLKLIHFWPRYWKTSLLLTDCVVVLRPTRHKIGNFGDVSPSQSFGLVWKKLNLPQQKHTFTNQKTKARFSRPLWQHFQAPYLFSSTFKVLEVLIPNSSIFKDISSTLWTLHYIDRAKYYASSVNKVTTFCNIGSLYLSLRPKSQTLLWDLINMQNVLNHVSDRSSQTDRPISLANAEKKFQRSACGSYYTALSYDIICDVFVLFTFAHQSSGTGLPG